MAILICYTIMVQLMTYGLEIGESSAHFEKRVPHLIPLPDRKAPPKREEPLPKKTGKKPPMAKLCDIKYPPSANVRKYDVVALNTRIDYNKDGDHDPVGIVFALKKDVEDILCGKLNPEPLILERMLGNLSK